MAPFAAEVVVVQSQGMARWLQLELATRLGLCANVRFPFPRAFAREIFATFIGHDEPSGSAADAARAEATDLVWPIWSELPWLARQPEARAIASYLTADPDGRKRHQLARRIARLFDDYAIFRPDLVLAWDAGTSGGDRGKRHGWQPLLWRKLADVAGPNHAARLRQRCLESMAKVEARPSPLPERVSLFGISSLPPFHVDLFEHLTSWSAVHLFLLQPTAEYWGDLASAKSALRQAAADSTAAASELHRHGSNSLLASLGGQGRDFLNVLLAQTEFNTFDDFADPGRDTLLHIVQSDLLNLQDPGRREPGSSRDGVSEAAASPGRKDDSIAVHSCHSPLRELEVLRDHILRWLDDDSTLMPRDILVMTPDIEAYAPLIDAVFAPTGGFSAREDGAGGRMPPSIPYSVADRASGSQSQIIRTFLRLLKLAGSRLGLASVIDLLETPAVRKRFGLADTEVLLAREWLQEAGVRWGRDETHRATLGLPDFRANTWAEGLDRLLLGFAMETGRDELFDGVLPCAGTEGQQGDTLARVIEFSQRVFASVTDLEQPRPLSDWVLLLRRLVGEFFETSEAAEPELQLLRDVIAEIDPAPGAVAEPFPLTVLLEHLEPMLAEDRLRGGFLTGRVTFGALKPMRSIPFRVICLLGMNDAAFPRSDSRLGFDLMAESPRLGDQSRREDDRYLFLETLLSARDRLHVSYVGQSIRDNSPAPPSVLVSELLDYLDQGYSTPDPAAAEGTPSVQAGATIGPVPGPGLVRKHGRRRLPPPANQLSLELDAAPGGAAEPPPAPSPTSPDKPDTAATAGSAHGAGDRLRDRLVQRHRLQAFSADYFGLRPPLFSYSQDNLLAARALRGAGQARAFLTEALPEPGPEWRALEVDQLAEFFVNPARYFLTRRLDIHLPRIAAELSEREPMDVAGLDRYRLKCELLELALAGRDLAEAEPVFAASGRLPLGPLGRVGFAELKQTVEAFCARLERFEPARKMENTDLRLERGDFLVTGRIPHVTPTVVLSFRPGEIKAKDRIRTWVRHVAWCAGAAAGRPRVSVLVGEPGSSSKDTLQYAPLDQPTAVQLLDELLQLYWRGLSEPLRFFPCTSLEFARRDPRPAGATPADVQAAVDSARAEWESAPFSPGESDDAFFRICFGQLDPLDGEFIALARKIGRPLIQHEERL